VVVAGVSSWARQTSDIGPWPWSSSSRYRPATSFPGSTSRISPGSHSLLV